MEQGKVYSHICKKENLIIPRKEILRYMQCSKETKDVAKVIDEFLPQVTDAFLFKGSFVYVPVKVSANEVTIADEIIPSKNLAKNLKGCSGALVFALSAGMEVDRLIKKYSPVRPLAALCINSAATAALECYADEFCREMAEYFKREGLFVRPRFSPGYGDFLIDYQPFVLNLTNASRLVGITLTDKYMMMPSKSVTAIMGLSHTDAGCGNSDCETCNKKDCQFKR